jgi:hypothetical protein
MTTLIGSWDLETLKAAADKLSRSSYEKMVLERVFVDNLCGYPNCSHQILRHKPPSSNSKRGWNRDIHGADLLFCSQQCMKASKIYHSQLSVEPVALRSKKSRSKPLCLPASSEISEERFNSLLAELVKQLETRLNTTTAVNSTSFNPLPELDRDGKPVDKTRPPAGVGIVREKRTGGGEKTTFDFISSLQRNDNLEYEEDYDYRPVSPPVTTYSSAKRVPLSPFNQLYLLIDNIFRRRHDCNPQKLFVHGEANEEAHESPNEDEDDAKVLFEPSLGDPVQLRMEIFADNLLKLTPLLVEQLRLRTDSVPVFAMQDAIGRLVRFEMSAIDDKSLAEWLGASLSNWQKLLFVYLLIQQRCAINGPEEADLNGLLDKAQMTKEHFEWLRKHLASRMI